MVWNFRWKPPDLRTFDQAKYDEVYGKLADGTFKPLRDVNEEGTSYTLDQISDGTIEVTEVK